MGLKVILDFKIKYLLRPLLAISTKILFLKLNVNTFNESFIFRD